MLLTHNHILSLSPGQNITIPAGLERSVNLGSGRSLFEAMQNWLFEGKHYPNWTSLPLPALKQGQTLEMNTQLFGIHFELPLQVTDVFRDQKVGEELWSGYVYATQNGHWLAGAERFLIRMVSEGMVTYEIRSFSWPQKLLAWPGLPIIRRIQNRFLHDSCRLALHHAQSI